MTQAAPVENEAVFVGASCVSLNFGIGDVDLIVGLRKPAILFGF